MGKHDSKTPKKEEKNRSEEKPVFGRIVEPGTSKQSKKHLANRGDKRVRFLLPENDVSKGKSEKSKKKLVSPKTSLNRIEMPCSSKGKASEPQLFKKASSLNKNPSTGTSSAVGIPSSLKKSKSDGWHLRLKTSKDNELGTDSTTNQSSHNSRIPTRITTIRNASKQTLNKVPKILKLSGGSNFKKCVPKTHDPNKFDKIPATDGSNEAPKSQVVSINEKIKVGNDNRGCKSPKNTPAQDTSASQNKKPSFFSMALMSQKNLLHEIQILEQSKGVGKPSKSGKLNLVKRKRRSVMDACKNKKAINRGLNASGKNKTLLNENKTNTTRSGIDKVKGQDNQKGKSSNLANVMKTIKAPGSKELKQKDTSKQSNSIPTKTLTTGHAKNVKNKKVTPRNQNNGNSANGDKRTKRVLGNYKIFPKKQWKNISNNAKKLFQGIPIHGQSGSFSNTPSRTGIKIKVINDIRSSNLGRDPALSERKLQRKLFRKAQRGANNKSNRYQHQHSDKYAGHRPKLLHRGISWAQNLEDNPLFEEDETSTDLTRNDRKIHTKDTPGATKFEQLTETDSAAPPHQSESTSTLQSVVSYSSLDELDDNTVANIPKLTNVRTQAKTEPFKKSKPTGFAGSSQSTAYVSDDKKYPMKKITSRGNYLILKPGGRPLPLVPHRKWTNVPYRGSRKTTVSVSHKRVKNEKLGAARKQNENRMATMTGEEKDKGNEHTTANQGSEITMSRKTGNKEIQKDRNVTSKMNNISETAEKYTNKLKKSTEHSSRKDIFENDLQTANKELQESPEHIKYKKEVKERTEQLLKMKDDILKQLKQGKGESENFGHTLALAFQNNTANTLGNDSSNIGDAYCCQDPKCTRVDHKIPSTDVRQFNTFQFANNEAMADLCGKISLNRSAVMQLQNRETVNKYLHRTETSNVSFKNKFPGFSENFRQSTKFNIGNSQSRNATKLPRTYEFDTGRRCAENNPNNRNILRNQVDKKPNLLRKSSTCVEQKVKSTIETLPKIYEENQSHNIDSKALRSVKDCKGARRTIKTFAKNQAVKAFSKDKKAGTTQQSDKEGGETLRLMLNIPSSNEQFSTNEDNRLCECGNMTESNDSCESFFLTSPSSLFNSDERVCQYCHGVKVQPCNTVALYDPKQAGANTSKKGESLNKWNKDYSARRPRDASLSLDTATVSGECGTSLAVACLGPQPELPSATNQTPRSLEGKMADTSVPQVMNELNKILSHKKLQSFRNKGSSEKRLMNVGCNHPIEFVRDSFNMLQKPVLEGNSSPCGQGFGGFVFQLRTLSVDLKNLEESLALEGVKSGSRTYKSYMDRMSDVLQDLQSLKTDMLRMKCLLSQH